MDSKKKISISFRNEQQQEPKGEVVRTQREQAAATEDNKKEEHHPVTPVYHLPHKNKKTKHNRTPMRPIITTALTALFVSLALGFLLLRMFVSLTEQTATGNDSTPVTSSATSETGAVKDGNGPALSSDLPSGATQTFDTFIVQAGAFSTEGKAKEWQSKLTASLVPSVIWNRDGQYFLFVGTGATKQEAEQIGAELAQKSVETYVKPFVVTTDKELPSDFMTALHEHKLGEMSVGDRQGLIEKVGPETALGQALTDWESQDDSNINWLKVAKSLE